MARTKQTARKSTAALQADSAKAAQKAHWAKSVGHPNAEALALRAEKAELLYQEVLQLEQATAVRAFKEKRQQRIRQRTAEGGGPRVKQTQPPVQKRRTARPDSTLYKLNEDRKNAAQVAYLAKSVGHKYAKELVLHAKKANRLYQEARLIDRNQRGRPGRR